MRPYYQGHPLATALFVGTLAVWVLTEARKARRHRPEATDMDRGSRIVIGVCWVAALLLATLARSRVTAAAFPSDALSFAIGLAIAWAGIGLRWWSFRTLGRYFTFDVMTSSDQPVITSGPYRIVRHPSYLGLLLAFAGIGVATYANWLSLAALILLASLGLANRIRVEEAALSATLGEKYRAYAAGRKRIIPFVW
jgi:protein-S-isoprenylcysteine O-methyltransferase Ste14